MEGGTQSTLDTTQDLDATLDVDTPSSEFKLVPTFGNRAGPTELVLADGENTIGRDKKCSHILADKRISKIHIKAYLENNEVKIVDASSNGTRVNGHAVSKTEPLTLRHGDVVTLLQVKKESIAYTVQIPEEYRSADDARPAKRQKLAPATVIPETDTSDTTTASKDKGKAPADKDDKDAKAQEKIDDAMTCGICQEIFYKPISLLPCLHNFCAACFSDWRLRQAKCPQCRVDVTAVRKNHGLKAIVEAHLEAYPDKERSATDKESMDKRDTVTEEEMKVPRPPALGMPLGGGGYDSEDSYFSGEHTDCQYCTTPGTDGYKCPDNLTEVHYTCGMCEEDFPGRPYDPDAPVTIDPTTVVAHNIPPQRFGPVECELCCEFYCDNYTKACPFGKEQVHLAQTVMQGTPVTEEVPRLAKLSEHILDAYNPVTVNIFGHNNIETMVLNDYLKDQNITFNEAFKETLAKIFDGSYVTEHGELRKPLPKLLGPGDRPVTQDSTICRRCLVSKVGPPVLHAYRFTVKKADLTDQYKNRQDCWYGYKCRTQNHNLNHAQRLNHACDNTR